MNAISLTCPRCKAHMRREGGLLCRVCLVECERWIAHEGARYNASHLRVVASVKCAACSKPVLTEALKVEEDAKGGAVYTFATAKGGEGQCQCDRPRETVELVRRPLDLH